MEGVLKALEEEWDSKYFLNRRDRLRDNSN